MIDGSLRETLLEREVTIGTWLQINSPTAAEVLANAGYEWVVIDIEHTDIDVTSTTALLRGMHGRGAASIARVATNSVIDIRRVLDVGATGVLVPLVNTPEQARQAVAAAKYPPQGVRGFSFCRANNWGVDFEEDVQSANHEIAVVVQIESEEGVENIEAILAVKGLDGVFIGPYDLSGSYDIPGQTQAPVVRDACRRVVEASERAGKAVGLLVVRPTPKAVERAIEDGFTMVCLGMDTVFLDEGARAARTAALSTLEKRES